MAPTTGTERITENLLDMATASRDPRATRELQLDPTRYLQGTASITFGFIHDRVMDKFPAIGKAYNDLPLSPVKSRSSGSQKLTPEGQTPAIDPSEPEHKHHSKQDLRDSTINKIIRPYIAIKIIDVLEQNTAQSPENSKQIESYQLLRSNNQSALAKGNAELGKEIVEALTRVRGKHAQNHLTASLYIQSSMDLIDELFPKPEQVQAKLAAFQTKGRSAA